jgi:hypothetical protein
MAGYHNSSRYSEIRPAALGTAGGVLVLFGALLFDQAFSSANFGRLIIRAWVMGVMGLMFVIPGIVAIGFATQNALKARRENGPESADKGSKPLNQV